MSNLVAKILAEGQENNELAGAFTMTMNDEVIFDFKGCLKTLLDNEIDINTSINRSEAIQKIFYQKKEEGEF